MLDLRLLYSIKEFLYAVQQAFHEARVRIFGETRKELRSARDHWSKRWKDVTARDRRNAEESARLNAAAARYVNLINAQGRDMTELTRVCHDLRQEVGGMSQELVAKRIELNQLQKRHDSAVASWSIDHETLMATRISLEIADSEVKHLKSELATHASCIAAHMSNDKRLREQLAAEAYEKDRWSRKAQDCEAALTNASVKFAERVGSLEIALVASSELEEQWKNEKLAMERRMKAYIEENQGWFQNFQEASIECNQLSGANDNLRKENTELREKNESRDHRMEELADKNKELLVGFQEQASSCKHLRKRNTEFREWLELYKAANKRLHDELNRDNVGDLRVALTDLRDAAELLGSYYRGTPKWEPVRLAIAQARFYMARNPSVN